MAINGIGSSGSYFNYQQAIGQIKLQQALSRNSRYTQNVSPVDRVGSIKNPLKSTGMDFLKSYSSTMAGLMESANSLRAGNSKSVMNDLSAVSSDTDVAQAALNYPARAAKEITLDVEQVAAAQSNVSAGVKGSEKASQDMGFTVTGAGGSVSVDVSALNSNGAARTNRDMLKEAAKQINAGNAGVKAVVTEKDGVAALELTSKATGTSGSFSVAGQLGAASGIEDAKTEAQNAQYSVTIDNVKRDYTSESNKISMDAGRVSASLKGTGETVISLQADSDKIVSAVSGLIDNYNKASAFLEKNADHGRGVEAQLSRFDSNLMNPDTMKKLGISKNKEGSLVLDKAALKKALTDQPGMTKELISGSYGLAQSTFNRATGAMSANSASLVSYDLQEITQQSVTDPMQFMNLYSRQGAYQMSNYSAIGMMMNYLV